MEHHDWASGLVYSETTLYINPRSKQQRDWMHTCDAGPPKYKPPRAGGAESLFDKSMRQIILNASTLTPETLREVPSRHVTKIWQAIRNQRQDSLQLWKTFAHSGSADKSIEYSKTIDQNTVQQPLIDILSHVTGPSSTWITDLCLVNVVCNSVEFRAVSTITNLRKLELGQPSEGRPSGFSLDDRMLQGLASRAVIQGAFRVLETLIISNEPKITRESLRCLNDFPALGCFVVYKTGIRDKDKNYGSRLGWSTELRGGIGSFDAYRAREGYVDDEWPGRSFINWIRVHYTGGSILGGKTWTIPVLRFAIVNPGKDPQSRYTWGDVNVEALLCFQRDRSLDRKTEAAPKPGSLPAQTQQAGNKKRKLKDSKAMQLGGLLDSF